MLIMNRIKYKVLIYALIIAALTLLPSCAASPTVPEVKHNPDPLWEVELEGANPEFVEDYIYLWDLLENEYPLLAAAERITGKDAQEIKEKYYARIPTVADPLTFMYFIVAPCLNEFEGTGHLWVFNDSTYEYHYSLYRKHPYLLEYPYCKYDYDQLTSENARLFYSEIIEKVDSELEASASSKEADSGLFNAKDNLLFDYYPERSAGYMHIKSMNTYSDENNPEYNAINDFLEKLESEGYENCIIDIRGNGGGNSAYWSDGIVMPNLSESVSWESWSLINGDLCKNYYALIGIDVQPINKLPSGILPKLNEGDLNNSKYFFSETSSVLVEKGSTPLFSGRFWLLVDAGVYSSSEGLAQFCKETGFATLVGTNTGGDGGGISPIVQALPNTGICVQFSADNKLNPDGSCNEEFGTTPDYPIAQGGDALEECLELIG